MSQTGPDREQRSSESPGNKREPAAQKRVAKVLKLPNLNFEELREPYECVCRNRANGRQDNDTDRQPPADT